MEGLLVEVQLLLRAEKGLAVVAVKQISNIHFLTSSQPNDFDRNETKYKRLTQLGHTT